MIRDFLFDFVAKIGFYLITANQKIGQILAWLIGVFTGITTYIIAKTSALLLRLISNKRYSHANRASEQAGMSRELEILSQVSQVKDNAVEIGTWTPDHTIAIQSLGSKLYTDCNWEEEHVHQYLREVVESIPGLSYAIPEGNTDEEDEEDEGYFTIG